MNSTVEYHIIIEDVMRGIQFTLKYETDGTIRPMWLEEMEEQLKKGMKE